MTLLPRLHAHLPGRAAAGLRYSPAVRCLPSRGWSARSSGIHKGCDSQPADLQNRTPGQPERLCSPQAESCVMGQMWANHGHLP